MPLLGYFVSQFLAKESNKKFYISFFALTAFSLIYFSNKAISNRILNNEMRQSLNSKVVKLEYAGWGYEADSLNVQEYNELIDGYYPNIPIESEDVFLYEWYEVDAIHKVEFSVPKQFNLLNFYNTNSSTLNEITELGIDDFKERHLLINGSIEKQFGKQNFDTTSFQRYKWERIFN